MMGNGFEVEVIPEVGHFIMMEELSKSELYNDPSTRILPAL